MGEINYSLVQRRNPAKKDAPKLYYASAQKTGDLSFDEIKSKIAHSTTATAGDVSLVLESLLKVMSDALKEGKAVILDKFGNFRLSFSSKGAKTMKEFTSEMIRGVRVLFHPCKELRPAKNMLSFEQKATVAEQKASLKAKLKGEVTGEKGEVKPTNPGTGGGTGGSDTKPTEPTKPGGGSGEGF